MFLNMVERKSCREAVFHILVSIINSILPKTKDHRYEIALDEASKYNLMCFDNIACH